MSTQQEWAFIHGLVRLQRPRIAVEVGVAYGGMATSIYKAMHENFVDTGVESWYTGFDLWDTHGIHGQFEQMGSLELVDEKLKNIGSRYALVKLDTQKEQQQFKTQLAERFTLGIDFAFIDGCHSYDGLKNDFYNILPHMNTKGIIALHDTSVIDGCREFVIDLRLSDDLNFDIMDFPYGTNSRNCGVTIITTPGHGDVKIDEICGSPNEPEKIYEKENNYRRV